MRFNTTGSIQLRPDFRTNPGRSYLPVPTYGWQEKAPVSQTNGTCTMNPLSIKQSKMNRFCAVIGIVLCSVFAVFGGSTPPLLTSLSPTTISGYVNTSVSDYHAPTQNRPSTFNSRSHVFQPRANQFRGQQFVRHSNFLRHR